MSVQLTNDRAASSLAQANKCLHKDQYCCAEPQLCTVLALQFRRSMKQQPLRLRNIAELVHCGPGCGELGRYGPAHCELGRYGAVHCELGRCELCVVNQDAVASIVAH